MVVGFSTTCAISAYHHLSCEFKSRGALDATFCDEVCQWLVLGWWFSPGTCTQVSSTSKTDCHDIAEILLKVTFTTVTPYPTLMGYNWKSI
jgi:hypothetical protein